jgi:hypothetical protein
MVTVILRVVPGAALAGVTTAVAVPVSAVAVVENGKTVPTESVTEPVIVIVVIFILLLFFVQRSIRQIIYVSFIGNLAAVFIKSFSPPLTMDADVT